MNTARTDAAKPESAAASKPAIDAIPAEVHVTAPPPDDKAAVSQKPDSASPAAVADTPEPKPSPETPKAAPPTTETTRGGGFFLLLLGGVAAGVIGFAVASLTTPPPDTSLANQIAAQSAQINVLEQRLAAVPQVDLRGVEAAQADLVTRLTDLAARVTDLENRPASSSVSSAASEGVAAEMDALRAEIAEMTAAAQTELTEARAQAAAIEENAAAAARNAAARAALARVQTALESGAPIGAALGDLEAATNESAPSALIGVQDGVPTLASLRDEFPEVARAALATARTEGVSGEQTTGFGAFLRSQFDVRSTTPQEGDNTDAVLSRAEAALRTGRLSDALAEISALPEVARAEMTDWLARAEARADAIAAVDILSTSLSDN